MRENDRDPRGSQLGQPCNRWRRLTRPVRYLVATFCLFVGMAIAMPAEQASASLLIEEVPETYLVVEPAETEPVREPELRLPTLVQPAIIQGTLVQSELIQPAQPQALPYVEEILDGRVRRTVPGVVPYVHQSIDTPGWFTQGDSACGSTALVMALAYLGKVSGSLGELVAQFHPSYSFGREPAEAGLNAYGVASRYVDWGSLSDLVAALDRGHVVIAGTELTNVGHIVLIIGYERVGDAINFIVHDPWGNINLPGYGRDRNGEHVVYSWSQLRYLWGLEVVG